MSKDSEKDKRKISALSKSVSKLNDISKDLISSITQNTQKMTNHNTEEINDLNRRINDVLVSEMEDIKSYGGEDISTFILRTLNDRSRDEKTQFTNTNATFKNLNNDLKSLDDIFTGNNDEIFNAFNERYRNEALLLDDLDTIRSQLIE